MFAHGNGDGNQMFYSRTRPGAEKNGAHFSLKITGAGAIVSGTWASQMNSFVYCMIFTTLGKSP